MSTVFHLDSASELNQDLLESIKLLFQSRPITILVEDASEETLSAEQKEILDSRLQEPAGNYLSGEMSIELLKKKYGL